MSRLPSFLFGLLVGAGLVFTTLKYHVVRAEDGVHIVPKVSPEFSQAYVDIRHFGPRDWTNHTTLAVAIERAGKGDLLIHSASSQLIDYVQGLTDGP